MIRELFHIGPLSISPFGVMLVAAFFSAFWILRGGMRHLGVGDDDDASALVFAAGFGGILGGKIYYAVLYGDLALLWSRAGLVWYGGLIGGSIGFLWMLRSRRLSGWPVLDAAAPALAFGYAVGRMGCFLVGDDYGHPTGLPWGMVFREGLPPTQSRYLQDYFGVAVDPALIQEGGWVAVHPTQLYETAIALVIFVIGRHLLMRRPPTGTVFGVVLALMSVERFGVEFLRAKDDRFFGPFTVAQAISVALLLVGMALVARARRARRAGEP